MNKPHRLAISLLALIAPLGAQAELQLVIDAAPAIPLSSASLNTANGLLTANTLDGYICTGYTPVDPAQVGLALQVDDNPPVLISVLNPPNFAIARQTDDTVIAIVTDEGTISCTDSALPEIFFTDGFE